MCLLSNITICTAFILCYRKCRILISIHNTRTAIQILDTSMRSLNQRLQKTVQLEGPVLEKSTNVPRELGLEIAQNTENIADQWRDQIFVQLELCYTIPAPISMRTAKKNGTPKCVITRGESKFAVPITALPKILNQTKLLLICFNARNEMLVFTF